MEEESASRVSNAQRLLQVHPRLQDRVTTGLGKRTSFACTVDTDRLEHARVCAHQGVPTAEEAMRIGAS